MNIKQRINYMSSTGLLKPYLAGFADALIVVAIISGTIYLTRK